MKIRKFAAALLALVLCLSLSLPAAFAEAQQRVELKNLTVNVKCTGNAIPDEQLTIRLTPRKKAPMPGDAAALRVIEALEQLPAPHPGWRAQLTALRELVEDVEYEDALAALPALRALMEQRP